MFNTVATLLATLAMILIVAGLIRARDRRKHVPLMLAAFAADVVGLLVVEVGPRLAGVEAPLDKLVGDFDWGRNIHALFATLSLVGYFLQIRSGRAILAGDRVRLIGHRKWAKFFLTTRLFAYVTMFTV